MLLLAALISLSLFFIMYLPCPCIEAATFSSILACLLSPSFLDTYSLSMLSIWCNIFCIVISFLVFWSTFLSPFPFRFKNGSVCLTMGNGQVLKTLIRFLLQILISEAFSLFWVTLFLIFFLLLLLVGLCPLLIFPVTCRFSSLQAAWCLLDLKVLFLTFFLFSYFSILAKHIFQYQNPFLYLCNIFFLFWNLQCCNVLK